MKKTLFLVSLLALSSCATQTVVLDSDLDRNSYPAYEGDQTFFINGALQEVDIYGSEICDSDKSIHSFQVKQTFANGLLSTLTYGIYTPRNALLHCTDN